MNELSPTIIVDDERETVTVPMWMLKELHHWARRYCDSRATYVTRDFNRITRSLLDAEVPLSVVDGLVYARDGGGRAYDGLTDAETAENTWEALGFKQPPETAPAQGIAKHNRT